MNLVSYNAIYFYVDIQLIKNYITNDANNIELRIYHENNPGLS